MGAQPMKEPCPASGRWLDLEPPCTVSCPECGVDTAVTDRWPDGVKPVSGVIVMDTATLADVELRDCDIEPWTYRMTLTDVEAPDA